MKRIFTLLSTLAFFAWVPTASAFKADHFKGIYPVISEHSAKPAGLEPEPQKVMVCDNDTVGNIWAHWGEGELPADLVPLKDHPALLLGFTFRDSLFFTLEENALIGPEHMAVPGANGKQLEIRRRPDGHFDVAVKDGAVTFYEMGPKQPLPPLLRLLR
jgi:hypothetical protein